LDDPKDLRPPRDDQHVVLLAEDEPVVRNIIRIALASGGYFVLAACDGKEALQISRQYPGTIHAVLTDIEMPKMDGLQLREKILKERPGIKVMLMSGRVESPDDDVPFLQKPFKPADLKKQMRELLR